MSRTKTSQNHGTDVDWTGVGTDANLKNTYPLGEGSEEKERECEGVERDTGVDEAF